ncbi:hypothetical protein Pelo_5557 [Pelomyxa schiedti]|nr:hypothetical protein Pelo_5557 [Pelomyxa schiedti]
MNSNTHLLSTATAAGGHVASHCDTLTLVALSGADVLTTVLAVIATTFFFGGGADVAAGSAPPPSPPPSPSPSPSLSSVRRGATRAPRPCTTTSARSPRAPPHVLGHAPSPPLPAAVLVDGNKVISTTTTTVATSVTKRYLICNCLERMIYMLDPCIFPVKTTADVENTLRTYLEASFEEQRSFFEKISSHSSGPTAVEVPAKMFWTRLRKGHSSHPECYPFVCKQMWTFPGSAKNKDEVRATIFELEFKGLCADVLGGTSEQQSRIDEMHCLLVLTRSTLLCKLPLEVKKHIFSYTKFKKKRRREVDEKQLHLCETVTDWYDTAENNKYILPNGVIFLVCLWPSMQILSTLP